MLELSQLFSNVELVMEASKELGKSLEASRAEAGVYAAIGEVFLSQVDYLVPVYANYCSNQQTALATLERLKTKKKMAKFLAVCFFLFSSLIAPAWKPHSCHANSFGRKQSRLKRLEGWSWRPSSSCPCRGSANTPFCSRYVTAI